MTKWTEGGEKRWETGLSESSWLTSGHVYTSPPPHIRTVTWLKLNVLSHDASLHWWRTQLIPSWGRVCFNLFSTLSLETGTDIHSDIWLSHENPVTSHVFDPNHPLTQLLCHDIVTISISIEIGKKRAMSWWGDDRNEQKTAAIKQEYVYREVLKRHNTSWGASVCFIKFRGKSRCTQSVKKHPSTQHIFTIIILPLLLF